MKRLFRPVAGIAMLEALVALAILAGTLLGLLYMHVRSLADAEGALRRTQALHLIDDLAERVRSNPDAIGQLPGYRSEWGAAPAFEVDCDAQACDPGQLAKWDLAQWKANVARALPQGDASIFEPAGLLPGTVARTLEVLVGWRTRTGNSFFELSVPGASCPDGNSCQFGHVGP